LTSGRVTGRQGLWRESWAIASLAVRVPLLEDAERLVPIPHRRNSPHGLFVLPEGAADHGDRDATALAAKALICQVPFDALPQILEFAESRCVAFAKQNVGGGQ
jgi:hypothetical protein